MNISRTDRSALMMKLPPEEEPPPGEAAEAHKDEVEVELVTRSMAAQFGAMAEPGIMRGSFPSEAPDYAGASLSVTNRALHDAGFNVAFGANEPSVASAVANLQAAAASFQASAWSTCAMPFSPDRVVKMQALQQAQAEVGLAVAREAEQVGMLAALNLPAGYKNVRFERFTIKSTDPAAQAYTAKLQANPAALRSLQAEADLGSAAARDMIGRGERTVDMLKENPELAKLYNSDPAFRAGFDGYIYAVNFAEVDCRQIDQRLDQEASANQHALAHLSFPA